MITVFGEEEYKGVIRQDRLLENYHVSRCGDVYSTFSNKILKQHLRGNPENYGNVYRYVMIPHPDKKRHTYNLAVHRIVMETWKPIDKYPPEQLKDDWDKAPQSFKDWVKQTAWVDHIDGDSSNNHIDNLRWVTPRQNHWILKSQEKDNEG